MHTDTHTHIYIYIHTYTHKHTHTYISSNPTVSIELPDAHYPSHHISFLAYPQDCIQCPQRADICKFLLVSQDWFVYV